MIVAPRAPVLSIGWWSAYANSLDHGAGLLGRVLRWHPRSMAAQMEPEKNRPLSERRYLPDLGFDLEPIWAEAKTGRFFSTEAVIEECLQDLVRAIPTGGREHEDW